MASAAAHPRLYRHRRPERTVLYRALAHHFERFLSAYEERFERTHGYLRGCIEAAVHRYLDCGIFAHGAARAHCAECGHEVLVAYSCKLRCLCPSCQQKSELQWAHWAAEELLEEVPHRQVVLTIPKRLRVFFRFDRRLLGELPGCAWRALRLYRVAAFGCDDLTLGAIGFLQTAGELLGFHPHLHVLLADGAWLADGTFRHLLYLDASQVEKLFRAEVLRLLVERGKIGDEVAQSLPQGLRDRSAAVQLLRRRDAHRRLHRRAALAAPHPRPPRLRTPKPRVPLARASSRDRARLRLHLRGFLGSRALRRGGSAEVRHPVRSASARLAEGTRTGELGTGPWQRAQGFGSRSGTAEPLGHP